MANFINKKKYVDALHTDDYPVIIEAMFIDDEFGYRIRRFDETNSDSDEPLYETCLYDIFVTYRGIFHLDFDEDTFYHIGESVNVKDVITTPDWLVWCKIMSDIDKGTQTLIEESLGKEIYNLWMDPSRMMFGFTIGNNGEPDQDIFGFYGTQLSLNDYVPQETFNILKEAFYGHGAFLGREFTVKYFKYSSMPFDWWDPDTNQNIHATGYAVAGYYSDGRSTGFSTEYEDNETWCCCFSMEVEDGDEDDYE